MQFGALQRQIARVLRGIRRAHLMEWRSHLLVVPSYWAFPWPGGGARPWPSGTGREESDAELPFRAPQGRATFFVPSATRPWPGAAARPWERQEAGNAQQLGTPSKWERHYIKWERHSMKWERPVTGSAILLNGIAGVGWW